MSAHVAIVLVVVLIAAVGDVRTGKIPNALSVPFWVAGLSAAALGGAGQPGELARIDLPESALVSVATLGVGYVVYAFGSVGGGDVKLLVALSAWIGFPDIVEVLIFSITSALLMVLAMNLVRGRLWTFTRTTLAISGSFFFPSLRAHADEEVLSERLPLGVAIFLGVCTWYAVATLSAVT